MSEIFTISKKIDQIHASRSVSGFENCHRFRRTNEQEPRRCYQLVVIIYIAQSLKDFLGSPSPSNMTMPPSSSFLLLGDFSEIGVYIIPPPFSLGYLLKEKATKSLLALMENNNKYEHKFTCVLEVKRKDKPGF